MNILLVDADGDVRCEVAEALRSFGLRVLAFADGHFAFLFLLARLGEIDAAVVNEDNTQGLLRRLEILEPLPVFAYSGRALERGARIVSSLLPSADASEEGTPIAPVLCSAIVDWGKPR
jgi:hypothetical protein